MNKAIMKSLGFSALVEKMENSICPFCDVAIKDVLFRDSLSLKEFAISGLCQNCQDEFFGKDYE